MVFLAGVHLLLDQLVVSVRAWELGGRKASSYTYSVTYPTT